MTTAAALADLMARAVRREVDAALDARARPAADALPPENGHDFARETLAAAGALRSAFARVEDAARRESADTRLAEAESRIAGLQGTIRILQQQFEAKQRVIAEQADELVVYRTALGGLAHKGAQARKPHRRVYTGRFLAPSGGYVAPARRVAVDSLSIEPGVSGGVEVYMKTLVRAITSMPGHDAVVICREADLAALQRYFGPEVGFFFFSDRTADRMLGRVRGAKRPRARLEDLGATFAHVRELTGAHLLHSPVQIFSCLDNSLPSVLNLHDLQHKHLPENFTLDDIGARDRLYGLSAGLADIVVATSQFVADDIVATMGVAADKVRVVPAAWNPDLEVDMAPDEVEAIARRHDLPANYIFFPGQFWKHKNQGRLVEALEEARRQLPELDLHLVLTGYRGHTGWPAVRRTIELTGMTDKVRLLDYVPLGDLPALYKRAMAAVVPSLFEASSYPVIEAQVMGCPSACSRVTSLPELMEGGAGLLFDPLDVSDIARAVVELCGSAELRARIVETARAKVAVQHSLAAYAARMRDVYDLIHPLPAEAQAA